MKYKLLALDIDGTIRKRDNSISDRVKQAILTIQKQGVKVAVISGRPVYGMRETAKELCLEQYGGYIMAHNGTIIVECSTDKIIKRELLPMGQSGTYYQFAKEHGCNMLTYDDSYMVTNDISDKIIAHEAFVNGMTLKKTDDFREYNGFPISKCMIVGDPDEVCKMEQISKEMFGPEVECFRSEPYYLEFVPKGIHKGSTLKALADSLGVLREEVAACGDGYNDLTMIKYAGLGVAMRNAQEEVKKAADYVTKTCEEDGVAFLIDKIVGVR
jgi:Cof subfamily protein (haloacid dehalogenase superfamily)